MSKNYFLTFLSWKRIFINLNYEFFLNIGYNYGFKEPMIFTLSLLKKCAPIGNICFI